ncbi:hypothetical protein PYCCODRAFT_1469218 [Trametes coccinea BRFM310]|uniref:GED domain-containing protein n=1 Tax=Trametes coccinea (strain BRFM310) TaxID=1353009 RepID=A0A1Y2II03_TRAC3|nr:hypothetical protein PYCCODRAFT_1469218 [Trametes coccinea BRFM310]
MRLAEAIAETAPPFLPYASWEQIPSTDATNTLQVETLPKDRIIWVDTVKSRIQASLTRELPNNVPYTVKCSFIKNFQQDWPTHADHCFNQGAIRAAVLSLVDDHAALAQQQLKFLLKYEKNPPATQNRSGLARLRSHWLDKYQAAQTALNPPAAANPCDRPPWAFIPSKQLPQSTSPTVFGTPQRDNDVEVASDTGASPRALNAAQNEATKPNATSFNIFATPQKQSQAPSKGFSSIWNRPAVSSPAASKAMAPIADSPFGSSAAQLQQPQTAPKKFIPIWDQPLATRSAASKQQKQPSAGLYEEEIALMAEIRAYFDISSKRLADNIPAAIDEHLLYAFSEVLFDTLVERLGLTSADASARCARYFAEDPDVAALREGLQAKKIRLDKVYQELCEFGL